jgi:hypothetical protein
MFESPLTFTGDLSYGTLEENAENTKNISDDILYAIHDVSGQHGKSNVNKKYDPKYIFNSTEKYFYSKVPHPGDLTQYEKYTRYTVCRADEFRSIVWIFNRYASSTMTLVAWSTLQPGRTAMR